jgi:putative transposase
MQRYYPSNYYSFKKGESDNFIKRYFRIKRNKHLLFKKDPIGKLIYKKYPSQFTNDDYINLLQSEGIQISMDGRGRALDNIFVERFFRTLKYEDIYLNEYENPRALRRGLNHYISFYNEERLHEALDYNRPADYYRRPQVGEIAS